MSSVALANKYFFTLSLVLVLNSTDNKSELKNKPEVIVNYNMYLST